MVFFSNKHRTICAVLTELKELHKDDEATIALCEEALLYARRMSDKLMEYKKMTKK